MTNLVIIPLLPFDSTTPINKVFEKIRTKTWTQHWKNALPFVEASIASWKNWTSRNNVILEISEKLPTAAECDYTESQIELLTTFPPTIQRWLLPLAARKKYGNETRIAMIDADTLISPQAPSIFEQAQTDVILTPDLQWNEKKTLSIEIYASMFPDIEFNKNLFFNAGVMVLNNSILPRAFLDFVLKYATEYTIRMTSQRHIGTDQTLLNFIFQQLASDNKLTASFLDSKWNAHVCSSLKAKNPEKTVWPTLIPQVVLDNHISHFMRVKELMPIAWQSIERNLLEEKISAPGRP